MSRPLGSALVGQAGGPTAVINQSLVGVIEGCLESPLVNRVLGARHGIQGMLEPDLIDLGAQSREVLEAVAQTPSSALGSVRLKPGREECLRVLELLRREEVRYFFYIGGNDSAETAHLLNEVALEQQYELRLFHVPKTIDNDLCGTDHCPGYGSAARYVALATLGDELDNRSLKGVKLNIIMGRHAGWMTAASSLVRRADGDGPHLIYLPENEFDLDSFAADVDGVVSEHGRCVVAISEGIHGPSGAPVIDLGERDAHGNVQLSGSGALGDFLAAELKRRLKLKRVRADTYGYPQRSFAGCVSKVDAREARAVGRAAVRMATNGEALHGSVVMRRLEGPDYEVRIELAELESVAGCTRTIDAGLLDASGGARAPLAAAFRDYAAPLVGPLPVPGRFTTA